MKKRKLFLIMMSVFLIVFSITGSVAYYNFSYEGKLNVSTSNAVFNLTSSVGNTQVISLGNNLKPGDSGTFNVTFDSTDSDVDMYATLEIIRTNLPDALVFYSTSDHKVKLNKYYSFLEVNGTKSETISIYWYWNPNGDDENDNSFIGKTISAEIKVDAVQISEYATMENGYYDHTAFWNATYSPYIRTIKFDNNLSNLPSSCIESNLCWDISESSTQSKKVYGYLVDSGLKDSTDNTKSLYNLYIVSESPIFAPSDCYGIFYFAQIIGDDSYLSNLISIDFNNNFNTSNVESMYAMFLGSNKLTNLDLSSFNTSNVTDISYMFNECSSLTQLDLISFNTSNVTNMSYMFNECSSLTQLDLSGFNTTNVTDTRWMFKDCSKLSTTIKINSTSITKYDGMFSNAATNEGAKIIVDYVNDAETLVDNMITTKSSNSNVVKVNKPILYNQI